MQYTSWTINWDEKNYLACKRKVHADVLTLKNFRLYMFLFHSFQLRTDQQAFQYTFLNKVVHGRLARRLDLLSECEFMILYKPGHSNSAAKFLSSHAMVDPVEENSRISREIALVEMKEEEDLEQELQDAKRYCFVLNLLSTDSVLLCFIWCTPNRHRV